MWIDTAGTGTAEGLIGASGAGDGRRHILNSAASGSRSLSLRSRGPYLGRQISGFDRAGFQHRDRAIWPFSSFLRLRNRILGHQPRLAGAIGFFVSAFFSLESSEIEASKLGPVHAC